VAWERPKMGRKVVVKTCDQPNQPGSADRGGQRAFGKANCSNGATFPNDLVNATLGAIVVAQLRYEYALSLMHRLDGTQTRVGLDDA
jgi:hypothetical protein